MLRHLNRQLEAEKAMLMEELRKYKTECNSLMNKVKENESLTMTIHLLETKKEDLSVKLESAQANIQSLSQQVSHY